MLKSQGRFTRYDISRRVKQIDVATQCIGHQTHGGTREHDDDTGDDQSLLTLWMHLTSPFAVLRRDAVLLRLLLGVHCVVAEWG